MYESMLDICTRTNDVARGRIIIDRMWSLNMRATDGTWNSCRRKKVLRWKLQNVYGKVKGGRNNRHPWGEKGILPRPLIDPAHYTTF